MSLFGLAFCRLLSTYAKQNRGAPSAYDLYLKSMDAATRQKVAVVAAFILGSGSVADMGMGSGSGSADIASLYPNLSVTGVDVNPKMVEYAQKKYTHKNLRFIEGDIAKPCFPPNSLKGIINSSVLHHVTSFNGYDPNEARKAIETQVEQLEENGVLIIRDFLDPGNQRVFLELPKETEPLFHRFTREFRCLSQSPGCSYIPHPNHRYELVHKLAVEFVLRKDYLESWDVEIQEEYTYFTIDQFEEEFKKSHLRILSSVPLRNPWIVNNRFKDQFVIKNLEGEILDYPATNYIIVGEKVPSHQGVDIQEGSSYPPLDYLKMTHFKRTTTNKIFDLVERPGKVLDLIPYFRENDQIYILARRSYPRPILRSKTGDIPSLDGSRPVSYITEPLNVNISGNCPFESAAKLLKESKIKSFQKGLRFFPSPGGVQEENNSIFVEIDPVDASQPLRNQSGFSTSGLLRPMEANQVLLASQVGAMHDVRLEMNVYTLFLKEGIVPSSWIGEDIKLKDGTLPNITPFETLLCKPARKIYEPISSSSDFLNIHTSEFIERNSEGIQLASQKLEFVLPKFYSKNTIAVALLKQAHGVVYIGVDDDDLPAAQSFNGRSDILVAPAWRVPKHIQGINRSRAWITERFKAEYGIVCGNIWQLGGHYYPSPGMTPEVVFPLAIEANLEDPSFHKILWLPLDDCVKNHLYFEDGHLRVMILRTASALGLLK